MATTTTPFKGYSVSISVKGKPTFIVDLNTGQGKESAERRALYSIFMQGRGKYELEDLKVERVEEHANPFFS